MNEKPYGHIALQKTIQSPIILNDVLKLNTDRHYSNFFFERQDSHINRLCDQYHTDKGGYDPVDKTFKYLSHNYAYFYDDLFGHIRPYVRNVFEFGIGTNDTNFPDNMSENGMPGASLRVWRDYFPLANVYGADIDRNCLFEEDRIQTHFVDQLSPSTFGDLWDQFKETEFDIMIDDGLHTFEAGINTFTNSFHKLKKGGIYIIEDVRGNSPFEFLEYFKSHSEYNVQFIHLNRGEDVRRDVLVVIRKGWGG